MTEKKENRSVIREKREAKALLKNLAKRKKQQEELRKKKINNNIEKEKN